LLIFFQQIKKNLDKESDPRGRGKKKFVTTCSIEQCFSTGGPPLLEVETGSIESTSLLEVKTCSIESTSLLEV